jgi:hypothetical protein
LKSDGRIAVASADLPLSLTFNIGTIVPNILSCVSPTRNPAPIMANVTFELGKALALPEIVTLSRATTSAPALEFPTP